MVGVLIRRLATHDFRAMASTILIGNKTHEIKGFDLPPFGPDLIEIQLSHVEDNKIRKAYNGRGPICSDSGTAGDVTGLCRFVGISQIALPQ